MSKKMVYTCDKCNKDCDNVDIYENHICLGSSFYQFERKDLCESCTNELYKIINDFYGK